MREQNCPVDVGDKVKLNYNGKGPDPHFEVTKIENDYHITLSNGATCYPKDFEAGRMYKAN